MRQGSARHRFGVVIGALLFVLAQAVTLAAASASAERPHLDAFGNPLCTSDFAETTGSGGAPARGLPDCCAHGCCTMACHAGVPALVLPEAVGIAWHPAGVVRVAAVAAPGVPHQDTGHRPGNPRAPPLPA